MELICADSELRKGLYYKELVSWSLTSPFSTNMAISEIRGEGGGELSLPSEGRPVRY